MQIIKDDILQSVVGGGALQDLEAYFGKPATTALSNAATDEASAVYVLCVAGSSGGGNSSSNPVTGATDAVVNGVTYAAEGFFSLF